MLIDKRLMLGWRGSVHKETQGPEGTIGRPKESASAGLLD
jgi:hypothetical protein